MWAPLIAPDLKEHSFYRKKKYLDQVCTIKMYGGPYCSENVFWAEENGADEQITERRHVLIKIKRFPSVFADGLADINPFYL